MVQAPARYYLEGWTIHLEEGTEIIFPQHMAHEVWSKGTQSIRKSTTHRLWAKTTAIAVVIPNEITRSAAALQQQLNQAGSWKVWRLSHQDWIAARQNKQLSSQKDHFTLATKELTAERVREGRTIWQCGLKFHYNSPSVTEGEPPTDKLKKDIECILEGIPFQPIFWTQAIYNEYRRQAPDANLNKEPAWEGFKGARHPWIQVNIPRPAKGQTQGAKRKWEPTPANGQGEHQKRRPWVDNAARYESCLQQWQQKKKSMQYFPGIN